jgi:hypothetical protein
VSQDARDFNRRSLYIFTRRAVPYPLLEVFDMASPEQAHAKRDVTTTPLQALTLYNDEQAFQWSQALAGRVTREAGSDDSARVARLYQILLARNPDETEKKTFLSFLDSHEKVIRNQAGDGKPKLALPAGLKPEEAANPVREAAFVDLVHAVVNSNDFAYRF